VGADAGDRGVVGFGLHVGHPGAVLCPEGAGSRRRPGAHVDPLRRRPFQHRRGGGLRRRPRGLGGAALARPVSPVRDGEGRNRSQDRCLAARLAGHGPEDLKMAYSDKVLDHYSNPRNVGSLPKDDPNVGTGVVGAPECGDVMKLQLKISDDGVVEDAKFKTFGCGSAIASSSYVTELVKGKTVDEVMEIKNTHIVQELSLPPVKIHCSVLAEDGIKAAISD